jgi:hypothetical protein
VWKGKIGYYQLVHGWVEPPPSIKLTLNEAPPWGSFWNQHFKYILGTISISSPISISHSITVRIGPLNRLYFEEVKFKRNGKIFKFYGTGMAFDYINIGGAYVLEVDGKVNRTGFLYLNKVQ